MTLLAPPQKPLCHLNSVTHEGKVVVVATDTDGKIYYTVKQDGFEDSYLFQKPENRTGWEVWKPLELPYEDDDQSVVEEEKKELTDQNNPSVYLFRSRYKTKDQSAVAPVQLVSGLGYIYVFRQSKDNTLLVDRFVLDGLSNTLNRKLEVRFKRSKQKYKPYKSEKKENIGLINVDSLDYRDINGDNFYEPTTELSLVNNLANGWFSVVLLQTSEQDKYRWHIFAYNSQTQKVELTTLRASEEGLFDVKDYTILDPEPRSIPGIIKRTLDFGTLAVDKGKGLTATKYDLQKERQVEGVMQLLRESVRVMLAVGTNQGNVAAISFVVAADGTLSQIGDQPTTSIRRSNTRQVLLPLNTLDEIKSIGTSNPSFQGSINGFAKGEDDSVVITSKEASKLDKTKIAQIKITGNQDYNCLYSQVTIIDNNTFEITLKNNNGGNWEVIPEEETGLIFNGMVTAYEITSAGKLKVTAFNHGLATGDAVQMVDTKNYDGTYTVTKVDDNKFSLDGVRWQSGTALNLQNLKRRGVSFDGVDDYIKIANLDTIDFSGNQDFAIEVWIKADLTQQDKKQIDNDIIDKWSNGYPYAIRYQNKTGKISVHRYDGKNNPSISSQVSINDGKFHHIAFVKKGSELCLYIDGDSSQKGNKTKDTTKEEDIKDNSPIYLGSRRALTNFFTGQIADVRIWSKARTEDEIKNSMYLQLTGKELGLVGYWRLDAIIEDKERKVIDFSVNGNDGTVNGGAYVGSVTLKRNLPGTATPAIQYENEELFAVTERATYTEEFEFKTDNNLNPNNVDGGKIFALIYKGKKSRNSQDWIPITAEATQFIDLGNHWWKARSRFTVTDSVSMVRSFGIADIKGQWETLDIRKHKIHLVSDSITEKKYTDNVTNLTVLVDNQLQLQTKLNDLELKEKQEALLLREKRELEFKIKAYNDLQDTRNQRDQLTITVDNLKREENQLRESYEDQVNNPLQYKYECKIVAKHSGKFLEVLNGTQNNGAIVQQWDWNGADRQKWRFERVDGDYYKIISCTSGKVLNVDGASSVDGANVSQWDWANVNQQKWSIEKAGDKTYKIIAKHSNKGLDVSGVSTSNGARIQQCGRGDVDSRQFIIESLGTEDTKRAWEAKKQVLDADQKQLDALNKILTATSQDKANWDTRLNTLKNEIITIQNQLNDSNTQFISAVRATQQTPQAMPILKTDNRKLETEGALLGFVRPTSRINAIETCEGNVQLSYFDDQGRMRQTNFDATADSKNSTFKQWIPDALRTCLNFNNESSIVTLNNPILLGEEWTIEAWFAYPLPETEDKINTLIRDKDDNNNLVLVKKEGNGDLLGVYADKFLSSGYDLTQLSPGWHHLTAVFQNKNQSDETTFYINGNKVGKSQGKTTNNVKYIGNIEKGDQQFGKIAEVRIWGIALSAEEIAVNSKTLLTGNEPDLLAYYPFNEAKDTTVRNQAGESNYDCTITGASWWWCAAPIGNLDISYPHQVLSFDGVDDYVTIPNPFTTNNFTISLWIKPAKLNTGAFQGFIGKQQDGNRRSPSLWISPDKGGLHYDSRDGSNQPVGDILYNFFVSANAWVHIAWVKEGTQYKFYRNGQLFKSSLAPINFYSDTNGDYWIGKVDNFFTGMLSEVCIWNKVRSLEEIQADMNKRLTGKEPGLVAYYPLNSVKTEESEIKVLDLTNNNKHGIVKNGATSKLDSNLRIVNVKNDAPLVSSEYSTLGIDKVSKKTTAMMRRFFATLTPQGVSFLPDKRIEHLELKWIGNGQFAPTLLGYIEGAPPIPSENLTLEDNYNGATSVELVVSEDVTFNWKRSQDSGLGLRTDIFYGTDVEIGQEFLGFSSRVAKVRAGFKGNLDFSYQFQNESSIAASSSLNMADKLQLVGTQEQNANFPHLGKRFIPKNVGYALVVSALADVFVTRLRRTGKMIGYQVLPVENIPPDVNTITFLINPAYTMSGSLDGLTGSSATSTRFFKHVPAMRSQFGSLYPASYYRLQEAYDLKKQIEQQDKDREAYFAHFNSRLLDEASLDRETNKGDAPKEISVNKSEDKSNDNLTNEQRKAADKEKQAKLQQETKAAQDQQSEVVKKKQSEIDTKIQDEGKRNHATVSFAKWQKNMEDIQIRAGKRNIVNTYVWDADGGLRSESQSFANTAEHSIGGSFSLNAGLGMDYATGATVFAVELTAQATVNLTQTMTKTETRSKGIQLNIDLSGVEGRSVTDYNDSPILPGEKVNRYRFMSFYLEGSTNNFNDFFSYVVDPEWLASNSEEARALRQARGKANKAWRVLHRVTYVERPALMGFGRDIRQLPSVDVSENQELLDKITALEESNKQLEAKLDQILKALKN